MDKVIIAAAIVEMVIFTAGAGAPTVVEVEADLAAEIAVDSEAVVLISQAFQLDVTSAEIHVQYRLNQTEVNQFCVGTVSKEMMAVEIHEVLIARRHWVDSTTDPTIDHSELHQDQRQWVQA